MADRLAHQCHLCGKVIEVAGKAGVFRKHLRQRRRDEAKLSFLDDVCPATGQKPLSAPPQDAPGFYWVRFGDTLRGEPKWSVSRWDGERWTNIGHEAEWLPEESAIATWRGPLTPPE
jgi:hypothetical protein